MDFLLKYEDRSETYSEKEKVKGNFDGESLDNKLRPKYENAMRGSDSL